MSSGEKGGYKKLLGTKLTGLGWYINDMQVRTKLTSRPPKFATYVAVRYVYPPHVVTILLTYLLTIKGNIII